MLNLYKEVERELDILDSKINNSNLEHIPMIREELILKLNSLRNNLMTDDWQKMIKEVLRNHKIMEILHKDPLAKHSYIRPRGYPGDADLMDYIYDGHYVQFPNDVSDVGKLLFSLNMQYPGSIIKSY